MGSIGEKYTLFAPQISDKCDAGEFDFPFADICQQEDFFKHLVWGEGNYQQFKYCWFCKPSVAFKVNKGLHAFIFLSVLLLSYIFHRWSH